MRAIQSMAVAITMRVCPVLNAYVRVMAGIAFHAILVTAGSANAEVRDHRTDSAGISTGRAPANPRPPGEPPPGWSHGHGPGDPRGAPPPHFLRNGQGGVTVSRWPHDHRGPTCLGDWC